MQVLQVPLAAFLKDLIFNLLKSNRSTVKRFSPAILGFILLLGSACTVKEQPLGELIDSQLRLAARQYTAMNESLPQDLMPRSFDIKSGELVTSGTGWWCSGFFPGSLWYLYEYTGEENLRTSADQRTLLIAPEQHNRGTHDLGFMINNSFGNGLRITGEEAYREVMINGAYSLLSRYNDTVGCIKSWDNTRWAYPVIIDNMMNLEYLVWAFRATGDSAFYRACISHADHTILHHFREDYSSVHLVDFDPSTGKVIGKQTVQGNADSSAWARGQSWGFYGFVAFHRETGEQRYLEQAEHIAGFLLSHPNMPADGIPYWDYNDPAIPGALRDASAGAILASGLVELSDFVDSLSSVRYLDFAEKILRTLASPEYRSVQGENGNFLLKHGVGHLPGNSEVDVPLTYADYYFIEALVRLSKKL